MVYIFGDTHVPHDISKLNTTNFPQQKEMTKNDYVIIAGDFGLIWKNDELYRYWKKWFNNKSFTTLFVDGNHENFEWLYQFPVIKKFGGRVGRISKSIYHLKRGEVYNILGRKFFIFGGGESIDKHGRTNRVSWWKEEMPNYQEMAYGLNQLAKVDYNVDYIITHTCPVSILSSLVTSKKETPLENFLEHINEEFKKRNVDFKWYFGHFHQDKVIGNYTCCYDKYHLIK